ncbi:MAG: hypothetical protein JWP81_2839 [Ferruginibacter sp.]|nr:hypothetical protein [Ferruginibacter sp.]
MKKSLQLVIISVLLLQAVKAQDHNTTAFKRFGFRAGTNFSHINFAKGSPPPAVPVPTSRGTGITFGFLMQVPLSGSFSIQPEYLFSQMGGKVKSSDIEYKLTYFSMPVFLKYQASKKFALLAGPQFDMLVSAKKIVGGISTNITHDTEERSIGATAGIEYQITELLSLCARYMSGLNNIGIGQRSNVQEFKYELVQLTVCVKF